MIRTGPSQVEFEDIARAVARMERLDEAASATLASRAQSGSDDARRRLIEANLHRVVRAVLRGDAVGVDPMEAFEAGSAGLAEAIATWEGHHQDFGDHSERAIARAIQPVLDAETRRVLRAIATEIHGREPGPRPRVLGDQRA